MQCWHCLHHSEIPAAPQALPFQRTQDAEKQGSLNHGFARHAIPQRHVEDAQLVSPQLPDKGKAVDGAPLADGDCVDKSGEAEASSQGECDD